MEAAELLKRITKAKRSQATLVQFLRTAEPVLGEKVRHCGGWLHFREWYQFGENGTSKLLNANFCKKHLLCQCCAVRRAGKMVENYESKLSSIIEKRTDLIPAMVTFTLKNGEDLEERFQHFNDSWTRFGAAVRKAKSNPEKNLPMEWNLVEGGVSAKEITYGNGGWHVHMHVFVLLPLYINKRKLSEEWQRFTGDSMITDVRKCRGGIMKALVEVLKYSTKFSSMTNEQILHVQHICGGARLVNPFGILRGIQAGDIDEDDISNIPKSEPYRDFYARWFESRSHFRIKYESEKPLEIQRPVRPVSSLLIPSVKLSPLNLKPVPKHIAESNVKFSNKKPIE